MIDMYTLSSINVKNKKKTFRALFKARRGDGNPGSSPFALSALSIVKSIISNFLIPLRVVATREAMERRTIKVQMRFKYGDMYGTSYYN